jgi:hypothetical protein
MTGRKDDGIGKRFPRRPEHALDVTIQCPPHDADAREHRGVNFSRMNGSMGMGRAQHSATRNGRQSAFPTLKPNLMGSADC